jgi:membrane associated rhomboid family serine protease
MIAVPLRDDSPSAGAPVMTYALVAACVAAFLWQLSLGRFGVERASLSLGMIPAVLFGHAALPARLHLVPPAATIFTSMFLHSGWLHLIGNMIYLWVFGRGVERTLGSLRFLGFYLLCGAIAALTQALTAPASEIPMVGASGAIAGVLGAYLVLYPFGKVFVFIWIIIIVRVVAVPAVLLLGLWFLMQLLSAQEVSAGSGGVAFWAHIGGFIAGMILLPFMRRSGVGLWQPSRTRSFGVSRAGRGSVPRAGRPLRGPWH